MILSILAVLLRIFKGALGVGLIAAGLGGFIALVVCYFFFNDFFTPSPLLFKYAFDTHAQILMADAALLLFVGVPLTMFVIWGFRLLLNIQSRGRVVSIVAIVLWTAGWTLVIISIAKFTQASEIKREVKETIAITTPPNKTLRVMLAKDDVSHDSYYHFIDDGEFWVDGETVYGKDNIKFTIVKSTDTLFSIEKSFSTGGNTKEVALNKAKHMLYNIKQADTTVALADYFMFPASDKLRGQKVQVTLYVPEGGAVFLDKGVDNVMYNVKNVRNAYDHDMVNRLWTMTPAGLDCIGCSDLDKGKGDGDVNTQHFSAVEVNGSFEVTFKKGPKYNYSVTAGADELKHVDVSVSDGVLEINNTSHLSIFDHPVKIEITAPSLEKIIGTGSAHINANGIEAKELEVELSGTSHADLNNITVSKLNIDVSGNSHVQLSGTATELDAEVTGLSHFNGFDLLATTAKLDVSGASHADVNVATKLEAEASGASHIVYKGSPSLSSDASGASSIKPEH